jgi:hypothetical protein
VFGLGILHDARMRIGEERIRMGEELDELWRLVQSQEVQIGTGGYGVETDKEKQLWQALKDLHKAVHNCVLHCKSML